MMMKKWIATLLLLLMPCLALAQENALTLTDAGVDLPGGSIHYPQMQGLDEEQTTLVNQALLEAGQISQRLERATLLTSAAVKLNVSWQADNQCLAGQVLSVVFTAEGAVNDSRSTHVYTTLNMDLASGENITWADLFQDEEAARAGIASYLEDELAPELSAHLMNSELTPLPEDFSLDASGMTLYYPISQLATLSDRAGAVHLSWCELLPYLKTGEGTVLQRIGAEAMVTLSDASGIQQAVNSGSLPGIPAQLGDNMQELVNTWGLLIDPDLYENGRLISLDGAAFRTVYLMTDRLTETLDSSVVQGIRMDRGSLYGLCIGKTSQNEWRQVLGEPDYTVTLNEEEADGQRLQSGESDYYRYDTHTLRLHANEDGVLVSLMLLE